MPNKNINIFDFQVVRDYWIEEAQEALIVATHLYDKENLDKNVIRHILMRTLLSSRSYLHGCNLN